MMELAGMAKSEVAVLVVGAGAAGVAAARRLHDAGVDALVVEARSRLGGRAWTFASDSGFPLDLGCGWLHSADRNPWAPIARAQGRTVDKTPPPWSRPWLHVGRPAFDGAAFSQAIQEFRRRVAAIGAHEKDVAAAVFLEPQNPWNNLIDAVSTYYSGVELDRVSARDLASYDDDGLNWRIVEGYGSAIAAHGAGLAVALDCAVQRIDHRGKKLRAETSKGPIVAQAIIVTLPSSLLAEQEDLFLPALPRKTAAAAGLPLGLADKLFLSLANAEEFDREARAFGDGGRTATAAYQFRPFGRPVIEAYFGGALAAELETGGEAAFFDFAVSELVGRFGSDFSRRVAPLGIHCWASDPLARGSYSCALPGKADCRALLAEPVDDRLFFAGEACSPTDYSTAHGAFFTGFAAAEQAIAALENAGADSHASG
jgi:monoamine oxidase